MHSVAGEAPRWVYLFSAFCVISYCQLDCMDGKQARRTKSSSPLGQLFDHGCDALSVNILLAMIGCSMNIKCGWTHAVGNFGVRTDHAVNVHAIIMHYSSSMCMRGLVPGNLAIHAFIKYDINLCCNRASCRCLQ